ncbi:MAG TPA: L,D-transpeptidase family protein [Nitrospirota bacterium]
MNTGIVRMMIAVLAALAILPAAARGGGPYPVAGGSGVVGETCVHITVYEDTLLDIARDNDLGYNEIMAANPGVDPWVPGADVEVTVPAAWILPDAEREGLVLNLAEMRLFRYFTVDGNLMVETFPVGVGREGSDTPLAEFEITEMTPFPNWYPPETIRLEKPELPDVVLSGPDNPLGDYKMRIGYTDYLIHGTNRPWGVGRRVSHGCIRLYPEDIYKLFYEVEAGEKVNIVYQPVKAGLSGGRLMVEVHDDYTGKTDLVKAAFGEVIRKGYMDKLDAGKLYRAVKDKAGYPVDVTK